MDGGWANDHAQNEAASGPHPVVGRAILAHLGRVRGVGEVQDGWRGGMPMSKLPVWSTALGAYDFVWSERRPFLSLALPAIAILSILTKMLGAMWATAPGTDEGIGPTAVEPSLGFGVVAVMAVYALATLAFWVTFCVAWHRHYLVPGEVATIRTALRWGRRQTRFLLLFIGIGVIIVLLGLIGGSIGILILDPIILTLLLNIGIAFVWARLAMLFPSTAVDQRMSFGECWMFTRGNGWRLFLVIFLVEIPIGVLITVTDELLGQFDSWSETLVYALVNQTMVFIGFAVGVSALSIAYRFLSPDSSAGTNLARQSTP